MGAIAVLGLVGVAYAVLANRLDSLWISGPMVFVAAGAVLGPHAADMVELGLDDSTVLTFTELTLATLLFADSSTVRIRDLEGDAAIPARLLGIGLPLTIVLGAVLALPIAPELGWAGAALIATVLAPTDAALGLAVVTDRRVPVRIRRALNVESGLNDGIATPFVTVFLAALISEEGLDEGSWVLEAGIEIGLAVLAALVVGGLGGRLLTAASARGWTSPVSEQLCVLSLAVSSYAVAVSIGGNGFVGAFAAGLAYRASTPAGLRAATGFTEDASLFASFLVWIVFGASFVGPVLAEPIQVGPILYAVLSLTVVRMAPVAVALARSGFRGSTLAFMGWFGPRGLASVVFTMLALEDLRGAGVDLPLMEIATWTVLLSVVLHGVTARPLSRRYGAAIADADQSSAELLDVPEPRLRRHVLGRLRLRQTDNP